MRHKSGATNQVTDALSRRHSLLVDMRISVPGFDTFQDLYASDPIFSAIITRLKAGEVSDFTLSDGFLFHGVQLCIPECSLRAHLIAELHGSGHVGRD